MRSDPETTIVEGFEVVIDQRLGHIAVYHDGKISWDALYAIKNSVWGIEAAAIEVYPTAKNLVNTCNCRHLWLLGEDDFVPDLLGRATPADTLANRHEVAWAEARGT